MKIFISQPMRDKSREEILTERKRIEKMFEGNEFIDSFINTIPVTTGNTRIWCLGESIKRMKDADLVVAPANVYKYAGCEIEAMVAAAYKIPLCNIEMYPPIKDNTDCETVCANR